MALLTVLHAAPGDMAQAERAVTAVRRALPRAMQPGSAVLLLCDLPDAPAQTMPQDALLLRRLQSGVMAIDQRRPGCALLLVRRRVWDDAARQFLGQGQRTSPRETVARLLRGERDSVAFDAASISPGALRGRFDAVLLCAVSLAFTPDTPARMRAQLDRLGVSCARAPVLYPRYEAEPLVTRLLRMGFTLTPSLPDPEALPLLATRDALTRPLPQDIPVLTDCPFVAGNTPNIAALLAKARRAFLHSEGTAALLAPVLTLATLLLSAAWGNAVLACLALILPELPALRRPSQLPGALVRLALLPALAASALDAWLARRLARSPLLRLSLPDAAKAPAGCVVMGVLLLMLSAAGVDALVPLLLVSLLWMLAPGIVRALDSPVRERIPLTQDEQRLLRADAEALFARIQKEPSDQPARRMFVASAACLLGLLEADEAARRIESLLPGMKLPDAFSRAAVLVSAQLLREHMGQCDAALRPLPSLLEEAVLAAPAPQGSSPLDRLMCAALSESSVPLRGPLGPGRPEDALFLPLHAASGVEPPSPLLPLTHPRTYLARRALPPGHPLAQNEETLLRFSAEERELRFLALTSALLGQPFAALLARSPVSGPPLPALLAREERSPRRPAPVRTRRSQPHAAPQ